MKWLFSRFPSLFPFIIYSFWFFALELKQLFRRPTASVTVEGNYSAWKKITNRVEQQSSTYKKMAREIFNVLVSSDSRFHLPSVAPWMSSSKHSDICFYPFQSFDIYRSELTHFAVFYTVCVCTLFLESVWSFLCVRFRKKLIKYVNYHFH